MSWATRRRGPIARLLEDRSQRSESSFVIWPPRYCQPLLTYRVALAGNAPAGLSFGHLSPVKEDVMPQEKSRPTFAPLDPFRGEENLLSAQAQRRWLLALRDRWSAAPLDPLPVAIPPVGGRGHAVGEFARPRLRRVAPTAALLPGRSDVVSVGAIDARQTAWLQRICPAADSVPVWIGQPAGVPPRGRAIAPRHCTRTGRGTVRCRLSDDPLCGGGQALWLRSAAWRWPCWP